jgi:hypothetical protein
VVGLVLIGSTRLSRSHFQIKNLLNSYHAGAHCNLITLDISALYSALSRLCNSLKASSGSLTGYTSTLTASTALLWPLQTFSCEILPTFLQNIYFYYSYSSKTFLEGHERAFRGHESELGYLFLTVQFAIEIASDLDVRDLTVSW